MKQKNPPSWVLGFLQFLLKEKYLEQIEGDLFELFERDDSVRKARIKFVWNSIRFLRLRYLKGLDDYEQLTPLAMVKNYLKVAFRTLLKQKTYAGINILGLAIGLASCLLIMMYIFHERSYDTFYPDVDRVYRVANGTTGSYTPPLLAQTMMTDYPQIEASTRMSGLWESHFKIDDKEFIQSGGAWADQNIFKVFQMDFVSGDPDQALMAPDNIVLTESIAKKCFPNEPAIGKTIKVDGDLMKVTAVVKDPPKNTHFPFKFIGASLVDPQESNNWSGNGFWTYTKIQEGTPPEEVNDKLEELFTRYVGPELIEFSGHDTFKELMAEYPNRHWGFTLVPVTSIHLDNPHFSMGARGDAKNVIVFSLVALFILLIACVNYINMATARSAVRSKEVGIRKALGSYRKNIIAQFLIESLVITCFSIVIALLISMLSIDYFNQLTGREFDLKDLFSPINLVSIASLLIIVVLLAGVYPAYIISSFSPLKALRGQMQQAGKRGLRSGLVAFQFAISIFLVAATTIIYKQVMFMQSQKLGVNIDQTMVIMNGPELGDKYDLFKNQLEELTSIKKVAKASNIPFHGFGDWTYSYNDNQTVGPNNAFVEPGIEDILDLEIMKGRFFEKNRVTDTATVVINESLAKELGWEDPLGKKLRRSGELEFTVIGVMKDFNYTSLKRDIAPMIFRYGAASSEIGMYHQSFIIAKVNTSDIVNTLNEVEEKWNQNVPEYPFDATFLSDSFQKHFEAERKFGQVFTTFSALAIFIAFLGLFALTTFVLQKRFKEIAVRKVLGASVPSLLRMMLKDFTQLVFVGGIVGIACAFYWLNEWLQGYSYRIDLVWYLLVGPILLIMVLTWIVVSLKSYKAATANPANALKEE
jgi:putative ABC transport system permease protein